MAYDIEGVREKLEKMNYGLVGETSAVQICRWTKKNVARETRLAGQNLFEILDRNNFTNSDSRNFQFYIPKKIVAPSAPRFLLETC